MSESAWLKHLLSDRTQVKVSLGPAPGRMTTPPAWDTGPRVIAEHLVYYFATEQAQAEIDGNAIACPRGSACWVTPGTSHRFYSQERPHVWRFRFVVADRDRGVSIAPARPFYVLQNAPPIGEVIRVLLDELYHADRWQTAMQRAWLARLSILFFRRVESPRSPRVLTPQQQKAIASLVEETPPNRWLAPRDLAKSAGLSHDYFTRVFHRTHGLPPRQWLLYQRLAYAVVLLEETTLRIREIADQLGYANPHLFTLQFSAHFGRSPRTFRQEGARTISPAR